MKVFAVPHTVALAATALCLCASLACAQSAEPGDPQAAPLQLQVPTQPLEAAPESSDNATVDAMDNAADSSARSPQLHGSVTAGIGYSKAYGTSTMEAADLDISGESESGNTYDMRIHVMQSKGIGFGPYGIYPGSRYRGN